MEIRPALFGDLDSLVFLLKNVVDGLNRSGIDQWDDIYPNRQVLEDDIKAGTLYVFDNGGIKGMVVANEFQDEEYDVLPWQYRAGSQLVIHRLCVDPLYQRQGVAQKLVLFVEDLAKQNGYASIRLDTFTKNPVTLRFYQRLAYQIVGEVTFRKGLFYCYEKRIL